MSLRMGLLIIEQVKSHKLLGIHKDQDLDFDAQSDAPCKSLSKKIGLLKHISPYLKNHTKSFTMMLYLKLLKPSFLYGSSVWSSTSKAKFEQHSKTSKRGQGE